VSAVLVFTVRGSSPSNDPHGFRNWRLHTAPVSGMRPDPRVFTIQLPPGRYVLRIANAIIRQVPGLTVRCPQRETVTARPGNYVGLAITCVYHA
jgi:hypothetical protein